MARTDDFYLGLATLLFVAGTAAIVIAQPFRTPAVYPDVIPAVASEADGRIRMDWNASHPLISKAERGLLKVRDGQFVYEYPVEKTTLRQGGLDYLRKSGDVSLTLVMLEGGKPIGHAAIHAWAAQSLVEQSQPAAPAPAPSGDGSRSRRR